MRIHQILLVALPLGFSTSCDAIKFSSDDTGDADSDSDSDSDSDGDSDSDSDSDGDPGGQVDDCDGVDPEDAPSEDCYIRELSCGDAFVSTTEGVTTSDYDGAVYNDWFCTPTSEASFQGGDLTYTFTHPGTGDVYFNFDAPCGDLSIFVMYWNDADTCPEEGNYIQECDTTTSGDSNSVRVWDNEENQYIVVIDSEPGEESPFGLSIDCTDDL